jgi:hypothetical protein
MVGASDVPTTNEVLLFAEPFGDVIEMTLLCAPRAPVTTRVVVDADVIDAVVPLKVTVSAGGRAESGPVNRDGRADRTAVRGELDDGDGGGGGTRDAEQVPHRVVVIRCGVTVGVYHSNEPAQFVVDVTNGAALCGERRGQQE